MLTILNNDLPTLNFFAAGMAEADISTDRDIYITFNNIGLHGTSFPKDALIYSILVDHPFYFADTINDPACPEATYVLVDREHLRAFELLFPGKKAVFLPHGGTDCSGFRMIKRPYDVVFACDLGNPSLTESDQMTPVMKAFINDLLQILLSDPYMGDLSAVEKYLSLHGYAYDPDAIRDLLDLELILTHLPANSRRKHHFASALLKSGIHATAFGLQWETLKSEFPDQLEFSGRIAPERCPSEIAKGKILINISPFFGDGAHERVYDGMLNGTVVATVPSHYLEEQFTDGEDILFFDPMNPAEGIHKIQQVLDDPARWNAIRENAYNKVKNTCTWAERAKQIASLSD